MEWTNYKKILLLLTMVSQSSVGVALSLAHLATYSWLPLEARQGDFFKYFCIMGFTTNWLVLFLSLHWVTVMAADHMMTRGAEHRRRGLVRREQQAVYGAFGYHTVI